MFQVTGAAYENERLANSICSRVSQQWTCSRTCLAGGGVSDKMFFHVGWNTGRENLPRRHRRLVQGASTHCPMTEQTWFGLVGDAEWNVSCIQVESFGCSCATDGGRLRTFRSRTLCVSCSATFHDQRRQSRARSSVRPRCVTTRPTTHVAT